MGRFIGLSILVMLIALTTVPAFVSFAVLLGNAMPWIIFGLIVWVAVGRRSRRSRWLPNNYWHAPQCPASEPPLSRFYPAHQHRRDWQRRPTWQGSPQASQGGSPYAAPQAGPATSPPASPPKPVLPADIQMKVDRIRTKAGTLQKAMAGVPKLSIDLYVLHQITQDYLPKTLDAYLSIPARNLPGVVTPEGRTALQELQDQLELLDTKLDEIGRNLQTHDLDKLLANGRFLEDRFGHSSEATQPSAN